MKLSISYNPYLLESRFKVNGKSADKTPWAQYLCRRRLQMWFYPAPNWRGFATELQEALNEREVELEFTGRTVDYQDLKLFCAQWNDNKSNGAKKTNFVLLPQKSELREDKNVLKELDKLVATFKDSPVEELRSEELQRRYQQERKNDFDMAVVATMSSGKSTLINALLGCDLLPAANDATTAKITRIHDNDESKGFTVECHDRQGNLIVEKQMVAPELLDTYNQDSRVFYIDLDGDIPGISGSMLRLNILDTPGPNNSATQEHRDVTNTVLHDKERQPIILYVMDSTKPEDESDAALLKDIAETIKRGGKQTQERFVFVMNKADMIDEAEDGKLSDVLRRRQSYLQRCGIEATQIIPVSANAAKLLRMQQSGQTLTKKQNGFLMFALADMHLDEAALLSPACRAELNRRKAEAEKAKDEDTLALISTGIIGLELTINEYLEKYAYPYKINRIIETFSKKLNEEEMHRKYMDKIASSQDALKYAIKALEQATAKKKELEKKQEEIENEIKTINFDRTTLSKFSVDYERQVYDVLEPLKTKTEINAIEANRFLQRINQAQKDLISNTQAALRKMLDDQIHETFDPVYKVIRDLLNHFSVLEIEGIDFSKVEGLSALDNSLDAIEQEDLFDILNSGDYVYEKSHTERRVKQNPERAGFFGAFKFWKPKMTTVTVTVSDGEFIDTKGLYNDASVELLKQFDDKKELLEKSCVALFKKKQNECADFLKKLNEEVVKELDEIRARTETVQNKELDLKKNKECFLWIEQCNDVLAQIV